MAPSQNGAVQATGVGSLPGEDFVAASRIVADVFGNQGLPFLPELPARGMHAAMIGRTLGLLDLPIDLLHGRWRLASSRGRDVERALSLIREDLDRFEGVIDGEEIKIKQQLAGPLTLTATLERQRGGPALADFGLRREVREAFVEAVASHTAELKRRFGPGLIIQIDEPASPAVLAGKVPTASGWSRLRAVAVEEAREHWMAVTQAISKADGIPVLHCCAPDVPVSTAVAAGFEAIAFDLSLAAPSDDWAAALEADVGLWFGVRNPRAIEEFCGRLGLEIGQISDICAVTTACGLAGMSPADVARTLNETVAMARSLAQ